MEITARAFRDGRPLAPGAVGVSLAVTDGPLLALLVLSAPGASTGTLIGLALGAGIGRLVVGGLLIPRYFLGDQATAHHRLEMRFGATARRLGAGAFMAVRIVQSAAVLGAVAALVARTTPLSGATVLVGLAGAAALPVLAAGVRGVVRADRIHALLVLAAVAAAVALPDGAAAPALPGAGAVPASFGAALVGGAAWFAAAYATDQLYVQRLLGCGSVSAARRAILVSAAGPLALVAAAPLLLNAGGPGLSLAAAVGAVAFLAAAAAATGSVAVHDIVRPSPARARWAVAGSLVALTAAGFLGLGRPPATAALEVTAVVYGVSLGLAVVAGLRLSDPMRGSPGSFVLEPLDAALTTVLTVPVVIWMAQTTAAPFGRLDWAWDVPLYAGFVASVGLVVRNLRKAVRDPRI